MEDVLIHILQAIVTHPDEVSISKDEVDSTITLTVTANQEDIGKIIGKNGQTIKAIRNILKILATTQRKWVNIEVAEANEV